MGPLARTLLVLASLALLPAVQAQPSVDGCADRARVRHALRLALDALRDSHPRARAALAGCDRAPVCGTAASPNRAACVTELAPEEWGFRVRVVPAARAGIPAELRLNVDVEHGTTHQVVVSANVWDTAPGVAMVGVTRRTIHTHGGEPARIHSARFHVWNESGSPLPVAVLDGVFLVNGHERPLRELTLETTSLPPGESELEVWFAPHEAYQSWNDHFSARVRFRVGQRVLTPEAEHAVSRVTPMRR